MLIAAEDIATNFPFLFYVCPGLIPQGVVWL